MRWTTFAAAAAFLAAPATAQVGMKELRAEQAAVPAPTLTERYGTDDLRMGELRLPAGKGPFPVAILIHGGCWTASFDTYRGTTPLAEALRRRGIAVWNVEYRRVGDPGAGWPGTFEDVAAAVDHLPKLAKRHPLDLKRVTIVGHSAGAHLALWAASRAKLPAPFAGKAVRPVSVVAIDGPGALAPFVGIDAQVCGTPVIVPLMGGTPAEKPAAYRIASPADHLPLGMTQLLVEAELGGFMKPYEAAARKAGDRIEVLEPAGANHFDIITPGSPNGRAVADWIAAKAF
ncbi:alpha/beta hydrolase [Sphingomonas sp. Leaf412]|uniref:alpha/beta hydrolase n=1 Tax=Sphingomonas sp. Leaf412 TaxID=1736370 RepID=UPI000AF74E8B|nr:alpha/beta hydrolase [Sphingomonas sp. Leaf412]